MAQPQILEKLSKKLASAPTSEENVVYILSLIRKIIEMADFPKKYCILNFYCNLALHSRIDKAPKKVLDMLQRVHEGTDYSNSIINFMDFHRQLQEFLKENNIPNFYRNCKIENFNKLLVAIYSDTPITLKYVEHKISVTSNGGILSSPAK